MGERIPDWMIFHNIMEGIKKEDEIEKIYKKLKNFSYDDSSNVTLTIKEFEKIKVELVMIMSIIYILN